MNRFSNTIITHKKLVLAIFIAIMLVCLVLIFFVDVNYNMVDYLPQEAQSTVALEIMTREFTESLPNASVLVPDISLMEASAFKQELLAINGVSQVIWLDDMIDLKQPLEVADQETIKGFYKENQALFSVSIDKGMEKEACQAIYDLIGSEGALTGDAPALVFTQDTTFSTALKAMAILLPIVILILILSTASWLEPLLFLLVIGISIIFNMGTNVFLGEISFMTNAIAPILQLACSLDYAVFLLHSFQDHRQKSHSVAEAMRLAIKESMSTVAASAATTLFGFLALLFMSFEIGADLGITLAKGIIFSFVSVMVFLPALILYVYKWIDKTKHRAFLPEFGNINKILSKIAVPVLVLVFSLILPAFLGQNQTGFLYGNDAFDPSTRYGRDTVIVEEAFGQSTVMALLLPRGDIGQEQELGRALAEQEHVTSVMSYATTVGAVIPPQYLGEDITSQFYSENYTRVILYLDTPAEGELAFGAVEDINAITSAYYGEDFYSLGQSANLYDMKNIVKDDNLLVNLIAIGAIFFVLLLTFKSAVLPVLLLLTIEAGIWVNLAIPYFTGTTINFLGYLVLSTVQLGATVDYAILLTNTYLRDRRLLSKKEAIRQALGSSFKSILVSAITLATAGFTLFITSSNSAIADIGLLLGRGTLLSLLMVVSFLPTMLVLFDKAIEKTTYGVSFYRSSQIKGDDFNEI